jgi:hypothetical protein
VSAVITERALLFCLSSYIVPGSLETKQRHQIYHYCSGEFTKNMIYHGSVRIPSTQPQMRDSGFPSRERSDINMTAYPRITYLASMYHSMHSDSRQMKQRRPTVQYCIVLRPYPSSSSTALRLALDRPDFLHALPEVDHVVLHQPAPRFVHDRREQREECEMRRD